MLEQREALVAQTGALGEDLDLLVEQCGLQETAVHVGDDDGGAPPVDVGLDFQPFEVLRLAQIKELEIDRVVDMAERVHVVETQLKWGGALERVLSFDSVIHFFFYFRGRGGASTRGTVFTFGAEAEPRHGGPFFFWGRGRASTRGTVFTFGALTWGTVLLEDDFTDDVAADGFVDALDDGCAVEHQFIGQ